MAADTQAERTGRAYLRFAVEEAHGRSPLYEALARGVAEDPEVLGFLAKLPSEKRQPNLLLAAERFLFGTAEDYPDFRRRLLDNADELRSLMLARSTQTNEPGRCATLLPLLSKLPQPLALLEVGASAGLCLLPDYYAYHYGRDRVPAQAGSRPVFPCQADTRTPAPQALPQIVWRAGLDLDPVDPSNPDQVKWLETLVWPEERDRLARLRSAIEIARQEQPRVVKGDLLKDLPALAAEAPSGATLVVFHTAVLVYVASREDRAAFARTAQEVAPVWIANEAPNVFPEIAQRAGGAGPHGRYLMSVNGNPVAWADLHGTWMQWIADPNLSRPA